MTNEDVRIRGETDAISAHLYPIFTAESKAILRYTGERNLARMIHEHTQRPLRYCEMYVARMSPMAIVATWHKLIEFETAVQEELGV